jgi:hypothetical protein
MLRERTRGLPTLGRVTLRVRTLGPTLRLLTPGLLSGWLLTSGQRAPSLQTPGQQAPS